MKRKQTSSRQARCVCVCVCAQFGALKTFANYQKKPTTTANPCLNNEEERSLNRMACKVRVKNMMKFDDKTPYFNDLCKRSSLFHMLTQMGSTISSSFPSHSIRSVQRKSFKFPLRLSKRK